MGEDDGHASIKGTMEELNIWKPSFESRICVLLGDASKVHFDLGVDQYGEVMSDVDAVVVSAGWRTATGCSGGISTAINAIRYIFRPIFLGVSFRFIHGEHLIESSTDRISSLLCAIPYVSGLHAMEEPHCTTCLVDGSTHWTQRRGM